MAAPDTDRPASESQPVASVVITNHDYAAYVGDAIDSAVAQDVPCQVVVVDDGSTDRSTEVIDRHRHRHRIEVVAKVNGGQASAINAGFARCRAPVVLFLDGDDRLAPDAAGTVVETLTARPDAVRCQFQLDLIDGDGRPLPGRLPEPDRALPRGDLRARVTTNPDDVPWQPTSGNAFLASVLDQLLPMPTEPYRISADHYLSNLSALYGPILAVDRPLGSYRIHGANADHRSRFDLERARSILVRTRATRSLLIEHGRRLGLDVPTDTDRFRSLTHDAQRLVSYRADPRPAHPFPTDRWAPLVGRAGRSAMARVDLPPVRRALALAWVAALGLAPRFLLEPIAARGLTR